MKTLEGAHEEEKPDEEPAEVAAGALQISFSLTNYLVLPLPHRMACLPSTSHQYKCLRKIVGY